MSSCFTLISDITTSCQPKWVRRGQGLADSLNTWAGAQGLWGHQHRNSSHRLKIKEEREGVSVFQNQHTLSVRGARGVLHKSLCTSSQCDVTLQTWDKNKRLMRKKSLSISSWQNDQLANFHLHLILAYTKGLLLEDHCVFPFRLSMSRAGADGTEPGLDAQLKWRTECATDSFQINGRQTFQQSQRGRRGLPNWRRLSPQGTSRGRTVSDSLNRL